MGWEYRIIHKAGSEYPYRIAEYYEDGSYCNIETTFKSLDDLKSNLSEMLMACDKPIIEG